MRILRLTPHVEKRLLARQMRSDPEAQSAASEIVSDVRTRGDAAVVTWTKKLDDARFELKDLWISQK